MWAILPEKRGYPGAAERIGRIVKRTEDNRKVLLKLCPKHIVPIELISLTHY